MIVYLQKRKAPRTSFICNVKIENATKGFSRRVSIVKEVSRRKVDLVPCGGRGCRLGCGMKVDIRGRRGRQFEWDSPFGTDGKFRHRQGTRRRRVGISWSCPPLRARKFIIEGLLLSSISFDVNRNGCSAILCSFFEVLRFIGAKGINRWWWCCGWRTWPLGYRSSTSLKRGWEYTCSGLKRSTIDISEVFGRRRLERSQSCRAIIPGPTIVLITMLCNKKHLHRHTYRVNKDYSLELASI